ncbi:MAG: hypothetical protein ACFFCZ_09240 [Promethearchaeota archaeon]
MAEISNKSNRRVLSPPTGLNSPEGVSGGFGTPYDKALELPYVGFP